MDRLADNMVLSSNTPTKTVILTRLTFDEKLPLAGLSTKLKESFHFVVWEVRKSGKKSWEIEPQLATISTQTTVESRTQSTPGESLLSVRYTTHEPQNGLANVLQTLMGALYLTRKMDFKLLVTRWPHDGFGGPDAKLFLDGFETAFKPIDDMLIVNPVHYQYFENGSSLYIRGYNEELYNMFWMLDHYMHLPEKEITDIIRPEAYSWLQPNAEVEKASKHFIKQNRIKTACAIHVRRTDHNTPTTDEDFFAYIDSKPSDEKPSDENIFLLTDNAHTREVFTSKYGGRILAFGEILGTIGGRQRHTSLQHSVTEVFIASRAKDFMGSAGSSFSELVHIFRDVNQNIAGFCSSIME